jgi:hypothetical protein
MELRSSIAILVGSMLIGASIVGVRFVDNYQIAPAVGADGNPFVWRMSTRTGQIQICNIRPSPSEPAAAEDETNPFNKFGPKPTAPGRAAFSIQCN